jgi:hypothetical protein
MPEIQIPAIVLTGLQVILAFTGAFLIALWLSLIVWTFRDARLRSRDVFAILLATLMVVVFGPLGLLLYFLLRPPVTLAELYERSLEEEALLQDLEERPRCPGCSRQVKDEWVLCPDCHTILKNVCTNCQNALHLAWEICPFCGVPVATPTESHDYHDSSGQAEQETIPMEPVSVTSSEPVEQQSFLPPKTVEPGPFAPPKPVEHGPFTPPPGDETRPQIPEPGPA